MKLIRYSMDTVPSMHAIAFHHRFNASSRQQPVQTQPMAGGTGLKGCYIPHSSVGGVLIYLSEAIQPIPGYMTESVTHGQSYCFLPGYAALPLSLGRYSFAIPLRAGGWVGPSGCIHTKMVHLRSASNRSTHQAQCTITLVSRPLNRNHRLSLRPSHSTQNRSFERRSSYSTQLNSTMQV